MGKQSVSSPPEVVRQLRQTFRSGVTRDAAWRRAQLEALQRLLEEQREALADAVVADLGRPREDAYPVDNVAVALEARHALEHLDEWISDEAPEVSLPRPAGLAWTRAEPLGVALVIGAWNYPVYLTLGPLVGALAAGNCVVVKPSEFAPATAALLRELVSEYLDERAVSFVEGDAEATQALIAAHVDHILFTGSTRVGQLVMTQAAKTLTPVTLELGGKCPLYVAADADLAKTARRVVGSKLSNAGQTCLTVDYVLVEDGVRDAFVDELVAAYEQLWSSADVGVSGQRIVNAAQYARVRALLDGHGGTVARGGKAFDEDLAIEPTVVVDPDVDSALMSEEIFGPLLPVVGVASVEAAVEFIEARPRPLAAYVFTDDESTRTAFIDGVAAGGIVVNAIGLHCLTPDLPFGGVGASGMGVYHGRAGFETFSHRKPVVVVQ